MISLPPRVALLLCSLAATAFAVSPPLRETKRGWTDLLQLDPNAARQAFAAAQTVRPSDREARLGEALALLGTQPRTDANIARAGELLAALQAENPGDDPGIAAAYYAARITQLHAPAPDAPAALAAYRALIAAHPNNAYAQLAAPKLAILLLYANVPPAEWERRAAEAEALLAHATAPEAVRDLQLILADAYLRLRRDHARALPLLERCLADALPLRSAHLDTVLIAAAESARVLGRKPEAIGYYERYLAEFPRNVKVDEIRRRIADLAAGGTGDPR
ncbi:MAG: hypothetical protein JSS11_12445 [Verrucomicrobia bacterium]|nr:hypothetical protein [Verrucomicrobiota bacterium]